MNNATATLSVSALVSILALACSSTSSGTASGEDGGGSSGGAATCTANTNDGSSACPGASSTCKGGTYCQNVNCAPGCLATANCGNGLTCDFSAATADPFLKDQKVGVCRACAVVATPDSGAAACSDVHGAYSLANNASSSSSCPQVKSGEATVTQTGCKVTITFPNGGGQNTATLDSSNKGTYTGSIVAAGMTVNENCTVTFTSSTMLIDCQLTASGGAADCKVDGAKK